jgi:hypothetical protein
MKIMVDRLLRVFIVWPGPVVSRRVFFPPPKPLNK